MTEDEFRRGPDPRVVDHPPHYNAHPSGVECIDVVEHMTFNVGNAVKYAWRAGLKGDAVEDYEKAIWYLRREIARVRATPPSSLGSDEVTVGRGEAGCCPRAS